MDSLMNCHFQQNIAYFEETENESTATNKLIMINNHQHGNSEKIT